MSYVSISTNALILEFKMRIINDSKKNFFDLFFKQDMSKEFKIISEILDENNSIYKVVYDDIVSENNVGRKGLTAEQIVRIAILKQYKVLTYDELEFHLSDSNTFRKFAKLLPGQSPKKTTLQENIKKLSVESWQMINNILVEYAIRKGIENADSIRIDATAVETNVHIPSDSSLIVDSIRVITRFLYEAEVILDGHFKNFSNHNRAAKKKNIVIENKKSKSEKKYKELVKIAENVICYADNAIYFIKNYNFSDFLRECKASFISKKLDYHADLLFRIVDQTKRRIFEGEKVPAKQKIFSIFEPHTDIIVKDNRKKTFGHKIFISTGKSGIVTDCIIVRGNPNDATLFDDILERQEKILGKIPKRMAADGGFASKDNLEKAKKAGVEDMAFAKKRGLKVLDMVRSEWIYKKLKRFRAGIEGIISVLKRAFGLKRCNWTTWEGFKKYIYSCIVAFNLQVLARS